MPASHPPLPTKPGHADNWIEKHGGLPDLMDRVARAIYWEGEARGPAAVSRAISMAIGVVKDWAAGRRGVTPKTRAKAVKAVAQWERMKAAARADNKD